MTHTKLLEAQKVTTQLHQLGLTVGDTPLKLLHDRDDRMLDSVVRKNPSHPSSHLWKRSRPSTSGKKNFIQDHWGIQGKSRSSIYHPWIFIHLSFFVQFGPPIWFNKPIVQSPQCWSPFRLYQQHSLAQSTSSMFKKVVCTTWWPAKRPHCAA